MKNLFNTSLKAVAMLCLIIAVILVGAAIVKLRFDLFCEAILFLVVRSIFLSSAREDEEAGSLTVNGREE